MQKVAQSIDVLHESYKRNLKRTKIDSKTYFLALPHGDRRWPIMKENLEKKVSSPDELGQLFYTITSSYNRTRAPELRQFLESLPKDQQELFFEATLPFIQGLVLQIETIFNSTQLDLLRMYEDNMLELNRLQVACLLACSFFTLYNQERRGFYGFGVGVNALSNYHDCNFRGMIEDQSDYNVVKIDCIIKYFEAIRNEPDLDRQILTLTRRATNPEDLIGGLSSFDEHLTQFTIARNTRNLDRRDHLVLLESSDYVGGQLFGRNRISEEQSYFFEHAEALIVSHLCEKLAPNEAILLFGFRRFTDIVKIRKGHYVVRRSPKTIEMKSRVGSNADKVNGIYERYGWINARPAYRRVKQGDDFDDPVICWFWKRKALWMISRMSQVNTEHSYAVSRAPDAPNPTEIPGDWLIFDTHKKTYVKDEQMKFEVNEQYQSIPVCDGRPSRLATFYTITDPKHCYYLNQWSPAIYQREITKLYSAFSIDDKSLAHGTSCVPLAVGNWGMEGVSGGDRYMKVLLIWIAATMSKRPLVYHPENLSEDFVSELQKFVGQAQGLTVESMWRTILNYTRQRSPEEEENINVFEFILKAFSLKEEEVLPAE